ncbi:hypothetical protein AVEN_228986-1 [Araneus ventricosus]|uniref:Uncharacterized protein n=1 Tax=Araneus ventricosus TaxID=182803 RepID=A0A4Y2I655_ARAVE|nr:hypothetical protein AVEN_228986-1 [Araneus ventricosus]
MTRTVHSFPHFAFTRDLHPPGHIYSCRTFVLISVVPLIHDRPSPRKRHGGTPHFSNFQPIRLGGSFTAAPCKPIHNELLRSPTAAPLAPISSRAKPRICSVHISAFMSKWSGWIFRLLSRPLQFFIGFSHRRPLLARSSRMWVEWSARPTLMSPSQRAMEIRTGWKSSLTSFHMDDRFWRECDPV